MEDTGMHGSSLVKGLSLFCWNRDTAPYIWDQIEPILCIDKRWEEYYTIDAFRMLITHDDTFTWTAQDEGGAVAVLITQFAYWPTMKTLRLLWAAAVPGFGIRALPFLDFIELWAHRQGAQKIVLEGRFGWERLLPDYAMKAVLLEKDISHLTEH